MLQNLVLYEPAGVYRAAKCDVYIDVNDIPDLRRIEKTHDTLTLGGNVSLTTAMETFEKYSSESGFKHLRHLAHHIDLIASVPVRNMGSIAGNLMIKHAHHEFPSDLFLMLETAGTQLHILDGPGRKHNLMLLDFLNTDMRHKVIYSVVLPRLSDEYEYRSYKIMPRAQNAHAHVNAGFLFKLDGGGKVLEKPNIIFGGINEHFLHAKTTEQLLVGKRIFDKQVLKSALETLHNELQPDHVLPDYSPKFRRTLAMGLFYKFLLSIKPDEVNAKFRSGGTILSREVSSGVQDFDTDKKIWPLNKPTVKLEAIHQTSGEAQYCNDLPPFPGEVFCAFVHTNIGNGKIESVDPSKALKMKGVIAFYSAKDVPGKNLCIAAASQEIMLSQDEILFAEKDVLYAGQPIGVIVAETHNLANEAAKLVEVKYSDSLKKKPIVSIDDAIAAKDETRFLKNGEKVAKRKDVINISSISTINISVKRIGGGYGAKISRNMQVACACALVCHKLNRPARFVLSIESNMMSAGKRCASRQEYEVGVDDNGVIQYLNSNSWSNSGCSFNELHSFIISWHLENCYTSDTWTCDGYDTRTDLPSNTYCRAPGSAEAIAMIEQIMEHIARVTKKDPLQVRLSNMGGEDKAIMESMIKDLTKSADYETRKRAVETFNNENRWKKKGIALIPMKFPLFYYGQFNAMVSICARDGTVCVTHGGIECGQGINTKVAQVVAYTLGIDVSLISVKPTNNLSTPNNMGTENSLTSESCALAARIACQQLLDRLEPIKKEMKDPSWPKLILTAHLKDVDLCARYMVATPKEIKNYPVYGVTIAEVEVDMLTGQHVVNRVDLTEDVGISLNPEVDIGQIEGAFVMGMGYWTSEDLVYDPKTGSLLTNRTWNYKPPGAKDIPVDFRVSFRKNAANKFGVLRSKATGEPALCMSFAIPIAIRNALNSARADSGNTDVWYRLDGPLTTERILMNSLTSKENMVL
ncbi:Xanthine dehydrogenase/oxidase [Harpegnathos saltator]|uniref:Xanthine dehydrogenase/oxidase n=1 Tax=Harpegnathos saltator TaxID=610380 RepID=E2BEN8_HARSA|nr:Xanthine dehydrogenase/oxidase [Harpegnathos saltator]